LQGKQRGQGIVSAHGKKIKVNGDEVLDRLREEENRA
jgi:hypothetical protein